MASPQTCRKRTGQRPMERASVLMSDRAAQPLTFGSQCSSPTSFLIRIGPTSEALFCRVGYGPLGRPPSYRRIAGIAIERERSRSALTKSEADLRTIIDAIPQLIIAVGADGTFLYANQTVRDYTGLTKEEVRSGGFREVFHPEDSDRLLGERDAALSRGVPFDYERRVRRSD